MLLKTQKDVRKGNLKELRAIFGEKTGKVATDIRKGTLSDDVTFYLFYKLADVQPITLSNMPRPWFDNPHGRFAYTLKSFGLTQFNFVRDESWDKILNGKTVGERVEGAKNLAKLATIMTLVGVGVEQLKDMLLGRDTDVDDLVIDALFELIGGNKFIAWYAREHKPSEALFRFIMPPVSWIDTPARDAADTINPATRMDVRQLRTWSQIPLAGTLFYWRAGGGFDINQKRRILVNEFYGEIDELATLKQMGKTSYADIRRLEQLYEIRAELNPLWTRLRNAKSLKEREEIYNLMGALIARVAVKDGVWEDAKEYLKSLAD